MKHNLMAATLAMGFLAACGGDAGDVEQDALLTDTAMAVTEPMEIGVMTAEAQLSDASGQQVGSAILTEMGDGVQIAVQVAGLPAGMHGIHIHETGTCTAPEFTSAGGHFNPTGMQHGLENPQGPHAGDMQNLEVDAEGNGIATLMNDHVRLAAGMNSLLDADGSALVIHAGADDQRTDPSGDSGARLACGVVTTR